MNEQQLLQYLESTLAEAVAFKRNGEYGKAIKLYKDTFNVIEGVPQIHEGLAKTLAASGNYFEASQQFRKAAKLYSSINHSEKEELCNWAYEVLNEWDKGSQDFKTVIDGWSGKLGI